MGAHISVVVWVVSCVTQSIGRVTYLALDTYRGSAFLETWRFRYFQNTGRYGNFTDAVGGASYKKAIISTLT